MACANKVATSGDGSLQLQKVGAIRSVMTGAPLAPSGNQHQRIVGGGSPSTVMQLNDASLAYFTICCTGVALGRSEQNTQHGSTFGVNHAEL